MSASFQDACWVVKLVAQQTALMVIPSVLVMVEVMRVVQDGWKVRQSAAALV